MGGEPAGPQVDRTDAALELVAPLGDRYAPEGRGLADLRQPDERRVADQRKSSGEPGQLRDCLDAPGLQVGEAQCAPPRLEQVRDPERTNEKAGETEQLSRSGNQPRH